MRDVLSKLVQDKPKHYAVIIAKRPELLNWVKANATIQSDKIPELVHNILYGSSNICPHGQAMTLININKGYAGCGPANTCACTKSRIAESVKQTKSSFTQEQHNAINAKRDSTMVARFGVAHNSQRAEIHHIWKKPKIKAETYTKLIDRDWMGAQYVENKRTAVDIAQELGVYYSTVLDYCVKHGFQIRQRTNYSLMEVELSQWLTELSVPHEQSNWGVIGKELDIYIPHTKLAIEINGLYWHSWHPSTGKSENKFRHLEKTQLAAQQGIQLLHVTDFEWTHQNHIIKSMILSKLGKNQRIFARKCKVATVGRAEEKQFLDQHHIQGYVPSKHALGLYYDDQLVSLMTIGKSRFSNKQAHELLRFCSQGGITVVGGGSKLLEVLRKTYPHIITYCDLSKSSGHAYQAMGFEFVHDTGPGYFWTDGSRVISRFRAWKSNLSKWLPNYDANLSESANMFAAGYRRFSDCGNRVFKI
jgi:hypothetical protein